MRAQLLTRADIMQYLQIKRTTFYKLIKLENLPVFLIGGEYRAKQEDLERWVEDRRICPLDSRP